jgi:hypothetical protein
MVNGWSTNISNGIPLDLISRTKQYYITGRPPKQIVPQTNTSKYQGISDNDSFDLLTAETEISNLLAKTQLINAATDGSHDPTLGKMAYIRGPF